MICEITIMDLLQNNKWKRPIYFAVTVGADNYVGLDDYLELEGMAYRITPVKSDPFATSERVNTEKMYDNMMHKFKWGGIAENPDIYMDENNLRMTSTFRFMFVRLAEALLDEARQERLKQNYGEALAVVLDYGYDLPKLDARSMSAFRNMTANYYANVPLRSAHWALSAWEMSARLLSSMPRAGALRSSAATLRVRRGKTLTL